MAHWNEERDRRWITMMRESNLPEGQPLIEAFENTGDLIYWSAFVELVRKQAKPKPRPSSLFHE